MSRALCTFCWWFELPSCTYEYPSLPVGPPPPTPAGCRVLSSSAEVIRPPLPRTEPSPVPCGYVYPWFPDITAQGIDDPDECWRCPDFPGYPDSWPPRIQGDPRYGPHTESYRPTGDVRESFSNLRYLVKWTRSIQCRDRSGRWGTPRTVTTTISYNTKWRIRLGAQRIDGCTTFVCDPRYL